MGVNNIKINIKESKDKLEIPVTISMDTIAGELKYDDSTIKLEKEDDSYKIYWNESLILPNMIQGDKVRVKIDSGSRGIIIQKDTSKIYDKGEAFGNLLGYLCKIEGVDLAGKTGTAEIKSTKDDEAGNENSWFAAVDIDDSKLSISMIMEYMKEKSISKDLVPRVRNIIESYIVN